MKSIYYFSSKSVLDMETDALVNTVNTEGVMGKGLALEFKQKYPKMFTDYKEACKHGFTIGNIHTYKISNNNPQWVFNFPTKTQWRLPSKMEYITKGLIALEPVIKKHNITSIAIPKLGCGLGGLDWNIVFKEIMFYSEDWGIEVNIMSEPMVQR